MTVYPYRLSVRTKLIVTEVHTLQSVQCRENENELTVQMSFAYKQ